jgi:negative regulator of sigma-B (phosphoserine phosphatase)
MKLEYASRVLPKKGESRSGDAVFVRIGTSSALFVLLDVLGHGDEAWKVAEHGLEILNKLPHGTDAATAISTLDTCLRGTRGAAATACSFSEDGAQLAGVGNVACRSIGSRCGFEPQPGILGRRNRPLSATRLVMPVGLGLVLHSDGVSHRFEPSTLFSLAPDAACEYILRHHRYQHDDASVLVIIPMTK